MDGQGKRDSGVVMELSTGCDSSMPIGGKHDGDGGEKVYQEDEGIDK